ncbi:glycosyl hydrolase [Flavobacterium sp. 245]|uniref:glycosyl hydrolase n=1 Tax=Flavobacterium sp. 245 TaxID=2512115 RepID=UPI00105F754E|nr:glycosyl hydrolase [Flavobacterium sp. 245]TDO99218.1 glycosyl hydrolase family 2 [Flavobacterium sp. 245]
MKNQYLKGLILTLLIAILIVNASFIMKDNDINEDKLAQDFTNANGPSPFILWQWMNGCVTKEGITYDLESFKKAGIKNVQQFLVGGSEADITNPNITILGDQWNDLMKFSLEECERLGIDFGTHNSPGWSASGAPGLKAEDAMQKLIWSKTVISGKTAKGSVITKATIESKWNFYRDICLIAVPKEAKNITQDKIIIITEGLDKDGRLNKNLPDGQWEILRFGHTTTGAMNMTAPVSGQGLEVDKMSRDALDKFWALYPEKLMDLAGKHAGKTFKRIEIDSYEAGFQDWTPKMATEFKNRRGYDLLPWLLVKAGYVVDSKDSTERFKYDMQRTINELYADNYYGYLEELIHKIPGLEFLCEPYGTGKKNFDETAIRGIGDMVMCEFWTKPATWGWETLLPVSSNAHVNGKKIVAAEAFTGQPQYAFQTDLADLKATGDQAFCEGVNLFVLHASAHQPWPQVKPGMTMGWWGTQFGPSQTWWEHGAAEWIEYVSRCQLLLQKGLFVSDLCYLQLERQKKTFIPEGYKGDICNEKEILNRFSVKDNKIVLPDSMTYKILILPNDCKLEPKLARKIEKLVFEGAVIVGNGFTGSPGLNKAVENNLEIKGINERLFGSVEEKKSEKKVLNVGKGKVYSGYSAQEALELENISKDVELLNNEKELNWIHRNDKNEDYYFISNPTAIDKSYQINFRVKDRIPELWDPVTGKIKDVLIWLNDKNKTSIRVDLEANGSRFIVFRKKSDAQSNAVKEISLNGEELKTSLPLTADNQLILNKKGSYKVSFTNSKSTVIKQNNEPETLFLNGNWNVSFEENRGAPSSANFEKLISWPLHSDSGIRFFSGTASYKKSFQLNSKQLKNNKRVFLDLGMVKNTASITVNQKKVILIWKQPFTVDITNYCKSGENLLEVGVTNLWPNRIIGDKYEPEDCVWGPIRDFPYVKPAPVIGRNLQVVPEWVVNKTQRPSKNRITFCTVGFFERESPLLTSGLIGPVKISIEDVWNLKE